MTRNVLLKMVNTILAIVFLFQVLTGLMHGIIPRKFYETLHGGNAWILVICVIIHLILNWSWVKVNFLKQGSK